MLLIMIWLEGMRFEVDWVRVWLLVAPVMLLTSLSRDIVDEKEEVIDGTVTLKIFGAIPVTDTGIEEESVEALLEVCFGISPKLLLSTLLSPATGAEVADKPTASKIFEAISATDAEAVGA